MTDTNMNMRSTDSQRGFTLVELMVASAVGLIAIMAMTSLFKQGMDATFVVTQRAETQQNMRAAIELMTKDISLAGSGLPSGGLQLATGGAASLFACNQAGTCYVPTNTYPNNAAAGTTNYMYGLLPGFNNGVQGAAVITAAPGQVNDSITSIYCDYNFPLTNFAFSFPSTTTATVTPAATITPGLPTNILAPGGLNLGDLILFLVSTPGNGTGNQGTSSAQTAAVVGEITGLPGGGGSILFANGDALNFNQNGPNSLASAITSLGPTLGGGNQITACRLNVVTYFLQVPPAGGTVQTPRLMRQVNGLTAVPVADNIINLQITYDVIDSVLGTISANQANPIAAGLSPALIQKVNLWVMGQSLTTAGRKAQSMYLASSVSARNMSFCNSYSDLTTSCQ
ncbi:MAG: prepilin-type N-terminal cleavage/methylation domain-containing protein [Candidatus Sulfotelmatobacter sp.]